MKLFILIFSLLLLNVSQAQLIKNYGLKVGLTSSSENWIFKSEFPSDFKTGSKIGLNVSAFAELFDLPIISIITEVGYNQKGMQEKVEKTTVNKPWGTGKFITISNRVDYLDLSLALKFNYSIPGITPYLFAGPGMSLIIASDRFPGYKIIYDDYENVVYGLNLGFGVEMGNILPISVLTEFQYNHDLSNSYKANLLKVNNNSFELKVGVVL